MLLDSDLRVVRVVLLFNLPSLCALPVLPCVIDQEEIACTDHAPHYLNVEWERRSKNASAELKHSQSLDASQKDHTPCEGPQAMAMLVADEFVPFL